MTPCSPPKRPKAGGDRGLRCIARCVWSDIEYVQSETSYGHVIYKTAHASPIIIREKNREEVWSGPGTGSELAFLGLGLGTVHALLGGETRGFLEELVEHPLGVEDLLVAEGFHVVDVDGQKTHLGL